MKILYAGDGPVGGAANYLLGVMKHFNAKVTHVPPAKSLAASAFKKSYDVVILSDMPAARVPAATQKAIARQCAHGTGLLMVGGWASFTGLSGGWKGTLIEEYLPVRCSPRDDRVNHPTGASVEEVHPHEITSRLSWNRPPVIVGWNAIRVAAGADVVLNARPISVRKVSSGASFALLDAAPIPLLVTASTSEFRSAAFATDFAPHWCGGLVDWGSERMKLPVAKGHAIEVGDDYVRLIGNLLSWL